MVATPEVRVTEGDALVALHTSSVELRTTEGNVLSAINYPTPLERTTWAAEMVSVKFGMDLRVSQAAVLVAVRGRVQNPKVRAWTFTLDGHDFYVLRLGNSTTLVYDLYSEQWMDWDAFGLSYWPVNIGFNWVDGQGLSGDTAGSNVLVGDDSYPLLYFLNPTQPFDQSPEPLDTQQEIYFPRTIQGQVPMVGRQVMPCYTVWLTTDMGSPAYLGAGVKLEISDDAGKTYDDMGTVTVTLGENSPELAWYSLGQIQAPGRLFRITDDGAVARIDNMEMNDPDDEK